MGLGCLKWEIRCSGWGFRCLELGLGVRDAVYMFGMGV